MADKDLMALGFSFDSSGAVTGIAELEKKLGNLESRYDNVSNKFKGGFDFKSAGFADFSALVTSISQNGKAFSGVVSSLKSLAATLPKLSGQKLSPISDDTLAKMQEFNLAGLAASNSLRNIADGGFQAQVTYARNEIKALNADLLTLSKTGRAVKEALAGIPGILNRLSGEKVKVITPEAIESMRKYAAEAKLAAEEIRTLREFTGNLRPVSSGIGEVGEASGKSAGKAKSLGKELLNIATSTSLPMFFRSAAKEAVSFGAELAQIESLTLNFSADKLRTGLLALPSAFGDAKKNANALYHAYSSGVEGSEKELVDFTAQMAKLSQVIRANQTDTVNAVTSAFNAYNLTVKDAGEVSDLFYAIVKRGKAEGNELASSIGQVIPTAATAGVKLNEMGAAITSLTKVMNTRNAITYLNNALVKLIKPTKESRFAAKALGIELGLSAVKAKGFSAVMRELYEKTRGNEDILTLIFPDARGQRAAMQLLNNSWADFQSQLNFFNNKAGITDLAFEKLNQSIEYQLSILPQTFNKIKIAAGDLITSVLTLGGALEPVLRAFNNMGPAGQKVVGALTLMGAVYGLLKAKTFLFTTVQSVEMRHQEVLSALRNKEIAERTAVTKAVTAETAAKTRLVKVGGIGKPGPLYRLETLDTSSRKKAPVSKRQMGFGGGFASGAAGGLDFLTSAWGSAARGLTWKRTLAVLRRNLTSLGKMLGNITGFVVKLFTPLNLMIAGAVTAGVLLMDFLSSKGDTFSEKIQNSRLIMSIGEGIYDFFTGALTEARNLAQHLENLKDAKLRVQEMKNFASDITRSFTVAAKNNDSFVTQYQTLMENYQTSLERFKSADVSKNIADWKKAKKNLEDFGDLKPFNMAEAVKRANEKFGTELEYVNGGIVDKSKDQANSGNATMARIEIEMEKDAFYKRAEMYNDLKKAAEEAQAKIQPAYEAFKKDGESLIAFHSRLRDLYSEIGNVIENQRFSMMKPAEQLKKQQEYIAKYTQELQIAKGNGNAELAVSAVKNILSTYSKMLKTLDSSIKQLKTFASNLADDSMENMIKSFEKPADKIKALNKRAGELWKESGFSWNGGVPKGENKDLEESYSKARKALELDIRATQISIDSKKKLAEAEKSANENTLKLISSMDKFNATSSTAVEALSTEAIQLQSRAYTALPALSSGNSAQMSLQSEQEKQRQLYEKLAALAEAFKKEADSRRGSQEQQRSDLAAKFDEFMTKQQEAAAQQEKKMEELIKGILRDGKQISMRLDTLTESSRKTADNTNRSANAVGQISVVAIG